MAYKAFHLYLYSPNPRDPKIIKDASDFLRPLRGYISDHDLQLELDRFNSTQPEKACIYISKNDELMLNMGVFEKPVGDLSET